MRKFLLALVLFLSFILRLYNASVIPSGLDWDEASIGWNAYTLGKTGQDEYGVRFPVSVRSFNDYKPSLYVYSTVPFVMFLGRTELAVRLPSILAGIIAVYGVFLLSDFLTKSNRIALLASLFIAVCPWHLQFSRVAFEANLALTFFIFGAYFLLKYIKSEDLPSIVLSIITFSASIYSYHSSRLVVPLFLVFIFLGYRKKVIFNKKIILISAMLILVLMLPLIRSTLRTGSAQARFSQVSAPVDQVIVNYFNHFSPNYLFFQGDNNIRHHAPNSGLLLWWCMPFLLIGSLISFKKNWGAVLIFWILIAPVASSLTKDSPHAVRSFLLLPPLLILCSIAADRILRRKILRVFFASIFVVNLVYFFYQYFAVMPIESAFGWQYGYKELVSKVNKIEKNYNTVEVTNAYDQAYVYFLYYGDDKIIINPGNLSEGFGKYAFGNKDIAGDVLIASSPNDKVQPKLLIDRIYFPNGKVAFNIGTLNQ